jgi:serine/threonine-protein kinase HipA
MTSISEPGYNILTAPRQAYVFVMMGGGWSPAAVVKVDLQREGRPQFSFAYGKRWRERADAFPLDPVHLPLDGRIEPQGRLFGALLDAGPDRWGTRLLDEQFAHLLEDAHAALAAAGRVPPRRRMNSAVDRLLLAGDDRVGALAFGPTLEGPLLRPAAVPIRDLGAVEEAMVRFDAGETVESDLALLATGTSMGGARPKATVRRPDGSLWLAKFRRKTVDTINVIRTEHAMMTLAKAAGIDVAETEVVSLGDREALLVRRFDRHPAAEGSDGRCPYLSAISLTGYTDTDVGGSYLEIADKMRLQQVGCPGSDLSKLFRRMVVNVACGNTDDHLKNHGFLLTEGAWRLSPAFDVVPNVDGNDYQAISVGRLGTTASWQNVLSECGRFGLGGEDAATIANEVLQVTSRWREHFSACGVSEADLRLIGRCMERLAPPQQKPASRPTCPTEEPPCSELSGPKPPGG